MSRVIWGHLEFTSSLKSSGNWNKTPGSVRGELRHFKMVLGQEGLYGGLRSVVRQRGSDAVLTPCCFIWTLLAILRSLGKFLFGVTFIVLSSDKHVGQSDRNKDAVWSVQFALVKLGRLCGFSGHVTGNKSSKQHTSITIFLSSFHCTFIICSYCSCCGDKLLLDIV